MEYRMDPLEVDKQVANVECCRIGERINGRFRWGVGGFIVAIASALVLGAVSPNIEEKERHLVD